MEEQYNSDPLRVVDATPDPTSSTTSSTTLSSSELTLRFPRPQGNRQLASWISSSDPDIMNPSDAPDDAGALAESYEFINTDDESQDGPNTETETDSHSLSSFDYARPSDVHSLDGTERTDDDATNHSDSEDEENAAEDRSRASSIQYAEQSLLNPSSRVASPPLGPVDAGASNNLTPMVRSIEFEEKEDPVYFKQVSAKHAIHSFTEEESASIAQNLNLPDQPKRLIAAVRQTMAQKFLATKEPLRMMYVGSHAARYDILRKISTAYTASASPKEYDLSEDDGMYTVVPFGSAKDPQVELMKTSQYQIKVENCTDAKKIDYQGGNFPGETVYSITIDNDHTFQSAYAPSGSVVEPAWTLPHVAIFYVTETDDKAARETREAAWGFMQRHFVPCIFISNTETFFQQPTDDWSNMINQHAVHLSVESSDRAIQPVRLPIDLDSFVDIDARQMNRNLAYLTGLYETAEEPPRSDNPNVFVQSTKMFRKARQYAAEMSEDVDPWTLAQTIGLSALVVISMLLSNWYLASSSPVPAVPTSAYSAPIASTTSAAVSTSTITINLTSTTTVRVPQAKTSQSTTAAVAPFAELADFIADRFPESPKAYVCSTERYSRNEILVKIPSSTKTSWLAKDSITIDVLKGDRAVKTKFSSIDEGILIEIPKKEAYGVLTIAVNTTRKPKINETFYIDLGKTSVERVLGLGKSISDHIIGLANNAAQRAEQSIALGYLKNSAMEDMRQLSARISTEAANTVKHVKGSWKPTLANAWKDMVQRQSHHAQDTLDWMDRQHKSAQINSWLLMLKIQRKTEEYDTYLNKAKKYLADKKLVAEKASKERLDREKTELRARRKKQRLAARCQSGFSRWTQQCKEQS